MKFKIPIISFFLLLLFVQLPAQNFSRLRGLPFVKNYSSQEYDAHEQNFAVLQNKQGVMYFANFLGILEFDGTVWHKIPTSSGMRVLSLAMDSAGTIYAGGLYDFGYLTKKPDGKTVFRSLTNLIPEKEDIGEILSTHCINNQVYFLSENNMYIYDGDAITIFRFQNLALSSFSLAEKLYVFFDKTDVSTNSSQSGFTVFENGKFRQFVNNSTAKILDVNEIFQTSEKGVFVLATSNQGFFQLRDEQIENLEVPVNQYIKKHHFTSGVSLSESLFALGTFTGGVVLCDEQGRIIQIIDKKSKLQDETINSLFVDKQASLWLATNDGISKVEISNRLSYFDNDISGLEGKIQAIESFENSIYLATDKGLFYLDSTDFQSIKGINYACWQLFKTPDALLVATSKGIFSVKNKTANATLVNDFTFFLEASKKTKNRIYAGQNGKFTVLNFDEQKLQIEAEIGGFKGDAVKLAEDQTGDLFLELSSGKIIRYSFDNQSFKEFKHDASFTSFRLQKKADKLFFSSEKDFFHLDRTTDNLQPYNLFSRDSVADRLWIGVFYEFLNDTFLITDGEHKNLAMLIKTNTGYKRQQTDFLPIADFSVQTLFLDKQFQRLLIGGKDGLIMFDIEKRISYLPDFKTVIQRISLLNNDSTIHNNALMTKLDYANNSLRFDFSVPLFPAKGKVAYRYFLQGFDKDSSAWTNLSYKDYTNLPDQAYTFVVEAKNEYGNLAEKAVFKFEIETPLSQRWWAYLIYFLLLATSVGLLFRWRMSLAEKERLALEEIVRERTEEIEQSKLEIEAQRDFAYEQKQQILGSINYAKRIQQAVLPSKKYVDAVLPEHFIFFMPRDIVSGDFYWLKKIENYIVIVAADCTGHGVPGAFMSMLGSSFLTELVVPERLTSPAEILDRLRHKVKSSLHQEGKDNEQKDGMDLAFIVLDIDNQVVTFSGAYNPLYLVRAVQANETPQLMQLKADRQPIGIHVKEKPFTNQKLQVEKGDCLYIFSDGYIDQFGGETGSKFKTKRFKELLIGIHNESMEEQKRIIGQVFYKWKGEGKQIDDVLVIGVRV